VVAAEPPMNLGRQLVMELADLQPENPETQTPASKR